MTLSRALPSLLRNPRLLSAPLSTLTGKTSAKNAKPSPTDDQPSQPTAADATPPTDDAQKPPTDPNPEDNPTPEDKSTAPPPTPVFERQAKDYKPMSIPYQLKVANLVHLVGSIGGPLKTVTNKDGVLHAITSLVDRRGSDIPYFWIPIIFQGELAESAITHVREEDKVYITGELCGVGDLSPTTINSTHQVLIHTFSFISDLKLKNKETERTMHYEKHGTFSQTGPHNRSMELSGSGKPYFRQELGKFGSAGPSLHFEKEKEIGSNLPFQKDTKDEPSIFFQKEHDASSISNQKGKKDTSSLWNDLINNPQEWVDYRMQKQNNLVNARYPDFKHKTGGSALWIDSLPPSIPVRIDTLAFASPDKKFGQSTAACGSSNSYPSKKFGQNAGSPYSSPSKKFGQSSATASDSPYTSPSKKFGQNAATASGSPYSSPSKKFGPRAAAASGSSCSSPSEKRWINFVENMDNWYDNRSTKKNPKQPDFVHKDTREGLWLSSSTPQWVTCKLPPLHEARVY